MKGIKHIVTPEIVQYLKQHYADTKNADILAAIGWAPNAWRSLRRLARRLNLSKSAEFMKQCQRATSKAAARANRVEGNSGKANLALGAPYRFKAGMNNLQRFGIENERRRIAKFSEKRKALIRKDKLRVKWGLEQISRLKVVREPRERTCLRHNLKRHGYIIPCRGSKTIFYTNRTSRSTLMEIRAAKLGITILSA